MLLVVGCQFNDHANHPQGPTDNLNRPNPLVGRRVIEHVSRQACDEHPQALDGPCVEEAKSAGLNLVETPVLPVLDDTHEQESSQPESNQFQTVHFKASLGLNHYVSSLKTSIFRNSDTSTISNTDFLKHQPAVSKSF